jgi:hypothetical protein
MIKTGGFEILTAFSFLFQKIRSQAASSSKTTEIMNDKTTLIRNFDSNLYPLQASMKFFTDVPRRVVIGKWNCLFAL